MPYSRSLYYRTLDTARQGTNPESSLCQDQQKHDKSAMTWHQNAEPRLYISILKEEGIRMSSKPMLSQDMRTQVHLRASAKCRCHVIEIGFNYFLLGGETGGSGKANSVIRGGDEVPRCLGSPSISGPGRWWGHYNRIGHAGTTLGGGATIIWELQLPSTPAPQSRNKMTKEGGGFH